MHWFDLGWLRRGDGWEFYPWGPFSRPYLLGEREAEGLKVRVRRVRLLVVLGLVAAAAVSGMAASWWPLAGYGLVGTALEAIGIWNLVRGLARGNRALGWEAGWVYLARWFGPKLTRLVKWLATGMVALSLYLVWLAPRSGSSYLLVGLFVGVLYLMHYLEAMQR